VCERGGISDFAKVLDFGLAGPIKRGGSDPRVTQAGMLLGTPDFMSPEQIGGEELSVASDIYAIGALAYYMLAGKVVFPRRTAMQALAAHVYETPAPLGLADSGALETIVLRCLAKTARERYADARELAAALAEAI
jgi:serine/threonine-protein kinase